MAEWSEHDYELRSAGIHQQYAEEVRAESVRIQQTQAVATRATVLVSAAAVASGLVKDVEAGQLTAVGIILMVTAAILGILALLLFPGQEITASQDLWKRIEFESELRSLYTVTRMLMNAREIQHRRIQIRSWVTRVGSIALVLGLTAVAADFLLHGRR